MTAQFTGDLSNRMGEFGPETALVDKILAETSLKDEFYQEAMRQLTPAQVARLSSSSDRPGLDLFSSGLVWMQFQRPVQIRDAADFASQVHGKLQKSLRLDDGRATRVRAIVDRWVTENNIDNLPDLSQVPESLRAPTNGSIRAAAEQQSRLFAQLSRELGLTPADVRRLNRLGVLVPMRN